jgi:ATP-dependent Lhr-like helicase
VKRTKKKTGKIPSWQGGRMPLSTQLGDMLRRTMEEFIQGDSEEEELKKLAPVLEVQTQRSQLPGAASFLMEYFQDREGYHLLMYPYEGRYVHEGMGALIAYRIGKIQPLSFSIAMNDYGFELLSDSPIPIEEALAQDLFSTKNLMEDIRASVNAAEMARRKFRDIASIAGLIFKGYPGKPKRDRHIQANSQLFFEVFSDYEPNHLLLLQAYEEVLTFGLQEMRLRQALERIEAQEKVLSRPQKATPLAFPIMIDRIRSRLSSERLEDRIKRMRRELER